MAETEVDCCRKDGEENAAGDLSALGTIAAEWCAPARRKSAKGKPLPEPLQTVLDRLCAPDAQRRYAGAAALLEDLEKVAAAVPANPEAWDRLLRHVRDNAMPLATLRQSA